MKHKKQGVCKMKKILAIIAILGLVGLLSSCGKKNDENTVKYWTFFTGGDGDYMKAMVDKFNSEDHGFKVDLSVVDWGSYYTKLSTSFLSGDLPDVAITHSAMLSNIPAYGETLSVEEIDTTFDWKQFPNSTASTVLIDNKHMAVPLDTHGFVLYYNPSLVAGTSLVDANGNWLANSWADLMTGLEEVKTKNPDIQPLGLNNPDVAFMWTWYSFYRQAGGVNFIDADGYLDVDIEVATRTLSALKDAIDKGYNKLGYNGTSDLMQEGRIAVAIEGTWTAGAIRPKQPDVKSILMPPFFGKTGSWANNHVLFFPKNSEEVTQKQKNALIFSQWLLDNGNMWAKAGHIPSKTTVQDSDEYKANPNSIYKELAGNMYPWPKNKNLGLVTESGVLVNQLQRYLNGDITSVEQVFTDANKEIANLQNVK